MFRINLHLSTLNFILSIFQLNTEKILKLIKNKLIYQNKKKEVVLTSQCRIGFLYVLKFLKIKKKEKNEIIFSSYNLPEMVNVAKNLNYNIKFCDLNYTNGFLDLRKLKNLISNKTSAIVLTNMFNDYQKSLELKKIAKNNDLTLIEDNAIYFDNYSRKGNKKKFSGRLGDFTLYSFNIMKNISALFGGAVGTNDKNFIKFYNIEILKIKNFPILVLSKQLLIFFVLKVMSINFLYKIIFFQIIKFAHNNNIKILLKIFYPSLKFKIKKFPNYYFTKISNFSTKLIYTQLKDEKRRLENFELRKNKNIYYYKNLLNLNKTNFLNLIKINDFNYQNFIDFPILVKNKKKLNKFLLDRGIEIRFHYYQSCESIFKKKQLTCSSAKRYEEELLLLPNHRKISYRYIDFVIKNIKKFYKQNYMNK